MIFLIDYDRRRGQLADLEIFEDTDREVAEDRRLNMELTLHGNGVAREVVLLQAASEEALKKTHRRYFADIATLAEIESHRWS